MPNPEETTREIAPRKTGEPRETSRGGFMPIAILLLILVGVGVWWTQFHNKGTAAKKGAPAARGETPPVAVVEGIVARKDVPIYIEGLGTVQAFNSVTIRSRVDGQLQKVAFTEGMEVHAGDLLAQIDPDPFRAQLEQAAAKKGQDEAQLANARTDLKRYADLLANEGVTEQVYATQKSLVNQLEATVKADEAAVQSAKVQLAYTTIVSPLDGRVGIRLVDQGNIVRANDATGLVVINQLKPISVVFTLPQQALARIHSQPSGTDLTVLAIGQDNSTILGEGKLSVIDNQIDVTTGTIKLKATFPNADSHLWPGEFVTARLLLTVRKDAAVVPSSVIQRGPEGAFAFVVNDDKTVDIRPVKVGQIENGEALVDEGLQPGEHVVVDGQYRLQKGSKVRSSEGGPSGGGRPGKPPGRDGGDNGQSRRKTNS